jgi:TerC family integral membrane protein
MLALDLGVFHRKAHVVEMKEALSWSAVWILLGLAFSVFVYYGYEHRWMGLGTAVDAVDGGTNDGREALLKYLTGYVIEKSLSVDNVFVIAMIFGFFAVPAQYQHRVLFWGILGALVMRGVMIAAGARLIAEFDWILYFFGGFLILTALKMLVLKPGETDLEKLVVIRLARRFLPISTRYHGQAFVVRGEGGEGEDPGGSRGWMFTPLALALLLSRPPTSCSPSTRSGDLRDHRRPVPGLHQQRLRDPRAAGALLRPGRDDRKFRYLKVSLAVVLMMVGSKMLPPLAETHLREELQPLPAGRHLPGPGRGDRVLAAQAGRTAVNIRSRAASSSVSFSSSSLAPPSRTSGAAR